jgi:hypothetical protein
MLPNPDHEPPRFPQSEIDFRIASLVCSELGQPIVAVGFGFRPVFGATMPEASVDEDGDFRWPEHHVGSSADFRERSRRDAVSQAFTVDKGADPEFRMGVATAIADHRFTDAFRGRPGIGVASAFRVHPGGLRRP